MESTMKVIKTSHLARCRTRLIRSYGMPEKPKGSISAKVGAKRVPSRSLMSSAVLNLSANVPHSGLMMKFGGMVRVDSC